MYTTIFIAIVGLVIVVLLVGIVIPRTMKTGLADLNAKYKVIYQEFSQAVSETQHELQQLKLQKVISRFDNLIGHVFEAYGCSDPSVNQKIRQAMQKKVITYEEFKVIKAMHLVRNKVVHEDRQLSAEDVRLISETMQIIGRLL
ncbi:MAG: hypothetical protein QY314_02160 [Candidatus Dojkabacteria bacterium]|nr:MAG: hypothetical protein QY314_02160 [Candidatus Dojkabacteria bacterium]